MEPIGGPLQLRLGSLVSHSATLRRLELPLADLIEGPGRLWEVFGVRWARLGHKHRSKGAEFQ